MKFWLILSAAVFFTCGLLGAKEYDNILHYKDCGIWNHNASIIREGTDAGRIAWDGKTLRFTPRGDGGFDLGKLFRFDFGPSEGSFDLKNIYCFGFAIRVPEKMRNQRFTVKFIYEEGDPVIWNLRTPPHIGWRGVSTPVQAQKPPRIRPGTLKAVEFSTEVPGFQAVLDDIRFVPQGLNFQFEEAWVRPVTDGCFFPEYTLEQQRTETLNDPDLKAKMAEIERIRQTRMKIKLRPQHTSKENLHGLPDIERIREDGSIDGLSYEDAIEIHKRFRYWHTVNETFMLHRCQFYTRLLGMWEWGRVPRTEENRKKLFRSLILTMTAECNRRAEAPRGIIPAFVLPKVAVTAYRLFFDEMEAVEKGISKDPDAILLNRLIKETVSRCCTHGFTDNAGPALTVDSFRGNNTNWTGGNFSYRPIFHTALICRNPKMLDTISIVAKESLSSITSWNTIKEAFWLDGMTADGSAWGHGNQNYPFGYPLDGLKGIGKLIGNLSGSRWEVKTDGPSFDHFCSYMEALTWFGTGWADSDYLKKADFPKLLQRDIPTACGRRGMRYNPGRGYDDFAKAYQTVASFLKLAPEGSVQHKRMRHCLDVITGKDRQLPVGSRYFWNNDLLICREKDSIVAVAMLSSRVRSVESAPSASHYTDFWNDGAAWIMKHFDSYRTARGFFDPCAIPGVTARQFEYTHTGRRWHTYRGGYNFAGGAADGQYAVCGFRMGRNKKESSWGNQDPRFYDLVAEKTCFWLNGILVCLGSGIHERNQATGAEIKPLNIPIATTLDQTLWRGPASFGQDETRNPGETFRAETQLLWHDGVGYWILNGKGFLSGETKKERWAEFDRGNGAIKDRPKTAPILTFQIDHGKTVKNDSYAYAVDLHCPDFVTLKKRTEEPPFEIVSATSNVHAVREKRSGTLAAVFFKPGEAGGLSVDAPAVVLLRPATNGKILVTVNDPEQDPKRDSVTLGWNGKKYKIQLPAGTYCGQPVTAGLHAD